jgi:glycerate dehydrogenase
LDGYAANPGDVSWEGLKSLGEFTVYDRTPGHLIRERIGEAEIILTNKTPVTRETMALKPQLRYIGVLATGYNVVDMAAANEFGIVVANVPNYSTPSVAQHVFALLLELCSHAGAHSQAVEKGDWVNSIDFCFWHHPLKELCGKTLGIIGFGRIGKSVAKIAEAFGMNVITASSRDLDTPELDALYRNSDVISLHCPLTDKNAGMIESHAISKMKDGAFLINTARGGLLNEADVADALHSGKLGAVAADVLSTEPPKAENPLLAAPRCVITPHIAWATIEARRRLVQIATDNVSAFLNGSPKNTVK